MIIFAKKHFSGSNALVFTLLINLAIYLRAFISLTRRLINKIALPLFDYGLILIGMIYLTNYWEINHRYVEGGTYPDVYWQVLMPSYIFVWLGIYKLCGVYDTPFKLPKLVRGTLYGLITLIAIYGLLPEAYRFSRALILLGSIGAGLSILASRSIFKLLKLKSFQWGEQFHKRFLIIGSSEECMRVYELLEKTEIKSSFIGFIHVGDSHKPDERYVGEISQLDEAINLYSIDELIFCSKTLSAQEIISHMSVIDRHNLDFKIAPEESMYVIGSNSINTQGELYAFEVNGINKPENIRNKRVFDIISSLVMLILFPILAIISKSFLGLLKNILLVLLGFKSWVSYHKSDKNDSLPKIKEGVLNPLSHLSSKHSQLTLFNLNMLYAKEYQLQNDLDIVLKNLNRLG